MPEPLMIQLKTLTPLWTGGVDPTCDRLHETGLIGSLRWWYEALVRGLGGYACDPTDNTSCRDADHCVACELFGCTGWERKFRLRVLDQTGTLISALLGKDMVFELQFVELRHIDDAERWLLVKAVEIAAKYGSIGRARKPGSGKGGNESGIVSLKNVPAVSCDRTRAKGYLHDTMFRHLKSADWPRLDCFFFVQKVSVKLEGIKKLTTGEPFLKGKLGEQGKKIFSFSANGGRVWGYARDAKMRDEIKERLKAVLGKDVQIQTGEEVIREL